MDLDQLYKEVTFKAVTSSGPGGQHVNKVATKVILEWNPFDTIALGENEKATILHKLESRITKAGILQLAVQESRSQAKNKELVFSKLVLLLKDALTIKKKRLKRTTPAAVKRKRLNDKKKHSEKKADRKFKF